MPRDICSSGASTATCAFPYNLCVPTAAYFVIQALRLYQLLIIAWAFGSFFPQWQFQKWYRFIGDIVQPYLNLFRWLPLRIQTGGAVMDLTPIVAMVVLQLFIGMIAAAAAGGLR